MKKLKLEEIKKIQLEILDIVMKYCHDNGIKCYLGYGTLIGAVRHKGYIPWDDDIDIVLLRKDYEYFIKNFNKSNDSYKVYEPNAIEEYPYPFAKVSFVKSVLKELSDNETRDLGVNIDVFPIDNLPKEKNKQKKIMKQILRRKKVLDIKSITISKKRKFYKNIILFLGKFVYKNISANKIARKMNELAMQYNDFSSEDVGMLVWGCGKKEIVQKKVFKEGVYFEFEGAYYLIPIGYSEWLTSIYGDYMKLPPIEEQNSHHDFVAYLRD